MIINQWVPAAHKGDAIGDSARRVRDLLRGLGHDSELYALTIDDDLKDDVRPFADAGARRGDATIFHYALPSPMTAAFASLDTGRVLWEASGRPSSVLYEPLLRGSETIGVLVVGWPDEVRAGSPHVTVVELLAHEAAAVIVRADTLSQLSDMASTDPLTGLPNRRAWDARVAQTMSEGKRFTIAMLDFDHFKEYNDTYGHPAGDRLLKETAAMWRHQLRGGDLLARLGGEEFGLLLPNCDTSHAVDVIERLRDSVYSDRTCSAGFAERRSGEPIEAVMARADAALYEAKSSGRDRACMSA